MTPRPDRPSEWGTIGEHEQRIRVLEAVDTGGSGGTVYCVGCYEVDPAYAECVNLVPGDLVEITSHTVLQGTLNPSGFTESETFIGPYLCNWSAGFRLEVRYVGLADGGQTHLWGGVSHTFNDDPGVTEWTELPTPLLPYISPTQVDTGWVTIVFDPTGIGNIGDDWWVWFGADNDSILFDATVGAGNFYYRWVSVFDSSNLTPQPQEEGQILVSVQVSGGVYKWVTLDPGTTGQVLTINGGGVPEWA